MFIAIERGKFITGNQNALLIEWSIVCTEWGCKPVDRSSHSRGHWLAEVTAGRGHRLAEVGSLPTSYANANGFLNGVLSNIRATTLILHQILLVLVGSHGRLDAGPGVGCWLKGASLVCTADTIVLRRTFHCTYLPVVVEMSRSFFRSPILPNLEILSDVIFSNIFFYEYSFSFCK